MWENQGSSLWVTYSGYLSHVLQGGEEWTEMNPKLTRGNISEMGQRLGWHGKDTSPHTTPNSLTLQKFIYPITDLPYFPCLGGPRASSVWGTKRNIGGDEHFHRGYRPASGHESGTRSHGEAAIDLRPSQDRLRCRILQGRWTESECLRLRRWTGTVGIQDRARDCEYYRHGRKGQSRRRGTQRVVKEEEDVRRGAQRKEI
jgi:hypothetical protein